jgi:hypothetical protein
MSSKLYGVHVLGIGPVFSSLDLVLMTSPSFLVYLSLGISILINVYEIERLY